MQQYRTGSSCKQVGRNIPHKMNMRSNAPTILNELYHSPCMLCLTLPHCTFHVPNLLPHNPHIPNPTQPLSCAKPSSVFPAKWHFLPPLNLYNSTSLITRVALSHLPIAVQIYALCPNCVPFYSQKCPINHMVTLCLTHWFELQLFVQNFILF